MITPAEDRRFRLLVISHLFIPDVCGGASIFTDMCHGLAQRNIDVTVRCAYPYYPEWKDKSGRNGLRVERDLEKGVHIERYGMFIPKNPRSTWQRLIYEGTYFLSLCRSLMRGSQFDAVIVFCPLAGSVAFAALNKLFYGKPLWLNVQDLPADAASASRIAAGKRSQKLLQAVQRWLFNRADVWSSISPIMVERLEQLRNRQQPVMFVPNWLHQSIADQIQTRAAEDRPDSGRSGRPPLCGQHRSKARPATVLRDSGKGRRSLSDFRSMAMEVLRPRYASG